MNWPQDKPKFVETLSLMAEMFHRAEPGKLTIEAYREALMSYRIEAIVWAGKQIRMYRLAEEFFPAAADIAQYASQYEPPQVEKKLLKEAPPADPDKIRRGMDLLRSRISGKKDAISQEQMIEEMDKLFPGTKAQYEKALKREGSAHGK